MRHPDQVISMESLIQQVWRNQGSAATVRTHIKTLRSKIEVKDTFSVIETIQKHGYCLRTKG